MSLLPFGSAPTPTMTGDSGAGGKKGSVPAPPSGSTAAGDFLSANGSWQYVDQSKPIYSPFSLVNMTANPTALAKIGNVVVYSGITGKKYAITIGASASTMAIYDISDQAAPVFCSNMATLAGSYNIAVATISGAVYAFVGSSGNSNLYIVNITNPFSPSITKTFAITGSPGSLYGIVYVNGFVYIATQNTGLVAVDVGNGASGGTLLAPVQSYQEGGSVKSFGVFYSGSTLYTTQYTTSVFTTRQIKSWSISTPQTPSLLQSLQVTTAGEPLGLTVSGNTAFVTVSTTGVNVIDLIDVTTPSAMANITTITAANGFGSAMAAVASGNYLFIPSGGNAAYGGSIEFYDISSRTTPLKIAQVNSGVANSAFGGIAISGGYIYAGDYGIAPGSTGSLDIFTLPVLSAINGNTETSTAQITGMTAAGVVTNSSSGVLSSVAPGTLGNVLTSTGSAWISQAPAGGGGGTGGFLNIQYPMSSANYWQNSNTTSSYTDFSAVGTIPAPTILQNSGFGSVALPSGNPAGVTFTALTSGVIGISCGAYIAQTTNNFNANLALYESSTATYIGYSNINLVNSTESNWQITQGFLTVTAGHTYTVTLQSTCNGSSNVYIGFVSTATGVNTPELQFQMFYVGNGSAGGSGITRLVSSISTATTAGAVTNVDYVYLVSGTTTITLPTAVANTNLYTIKNTGVNTVSIATTSSQTIDGSASPITLPVANTSLDLISDGSNWRLV